MRKRRCSFETTPHDEASSSTVSPADALNEDHPDPAAASILPSKLRCESAKGHRARRFDEKARAGHTFWLLMTAQKDPQGERNASRSQSKDMTCHVCGKNALADNSNESGLSKEVAEDTPKASQQTSIVQFFQLPGQQSPLSKSSIAAPSSTNDLTKSCHRCTVCSAPLCQACHVNSMQLECDNCALRGICRFCLVTRYDRSESYCVCEDCARNET